MFERRHALIVVAVLFAALLGLPGVGAVPEAAAQTISVTAADPPAGEQGTISLPVTIKGSGFKKGAKAKFYVTGTSDPGGITVSSTRFVSSTQLTATIDVAGTATAAKFDIVVQNTDGRTGKGTELFNVLEKVDPCMVPDPVPTGGYCFSGVPGVPGCLDTTFGGGSGKVIGPRDVQVGYFSGKALAIDGVGRIVTAGFQHDTCKTGSAYEWAVMRRLSDGSPDLAFGPSGNGILTVAFAGGAFAHSVVVQPDNKIVVVGRAKQSKSGDILPVAIRLNENGTLDTSFSGDGIAWVPPAGKFPSGLFYAVAIQSDGKIVAAGTTRGTGYLSRLKSDGTLDPAFNGGRPYLWSAQAVFNAVTTQWVGGAERIVVVGHVKGLSDNLDAAVWRFTGSGLLESEFGVAGIAQFSFLVRDDLHYYEDAFLDVAIDSSNRIVAGGYTLVATPPSIQTESRIALARFDATGALDSLFGVGGTVIAPSGQTYAIGRVVAIEGGGKILLAGYSNDYDAAGNSADPLAGMWRFNADGTVDPAFGAGGWVWDPLTLGTRAVSWTGMALLPDGRIVCGGSVIIEGTTPISYAALARFWQ